jgi:hypothetical protein
VVTNSPAPRPRSRRRRTNFLTQDAAEKRALYEEFLDTRAPNGRAIGRAKRGVYAFFDFDGEPIYVGQTVEAVSARLGRHMTGQRSDALVNRVLDPMEVAYIEVYPLWELEALDNVAVRPLIDAAELALHQKVIAESPIGAVLNEKDPPPLAPGLNAFVLPEPYRAKVVSDASWERLAHRDERISRRAAQLAALSSVIKERTVSLGLRRTQVTQAKRLLRVAEARYAEVTGELPPDEVARQTTGHDEDARS